MPIDQHTASIDGHRYDMSMLGATASLRLFHRLFRMLGPSVGHLIDSIGAKGKASLLDVDVSSKAFVAGFESLASAVSESDLEHVVDQLRKQTTLSLPEGKVIPLAQVFDAHFQGRIGAMFQWLAWGLRVQYGDFWSALASMTPQGEGGESRAASDPTA